MMSPTAFALLPLIVLTVTAVVLMLLIAFYRNHTLTLALTLLGLALAAASLPLAGRAIGAGLEVTRLIVVDRFALFYIGLLLAGSFAVALLGYDYLEDHSEQQEEFYLLLLLATLGGTVLVTSSHFASFFLGLEILSVSLYSLIAYTREKRQSIEAGIKYLVLAAASSAFLLFGMALVYSQAGSMDLGTLASLGAVPGAAQNLVLITGLAMLIIGIGFKLAVVPFHMWTPDVYEGAPAPVTAFVATVSKGGMFALLLRYFLVINVYNFRALFVIFAAIAVASMLIGNLLALLQTNIKRILAYSSIAHLGYMLVAFLASGGTAVVAVTFYLVSYFATTLGAFAVVSVLSTPERDADSMADYQGLFWRRPWLAGILTASLLSLAGMPLTAGFVGKFFLVAVGVNAALWVLVFSLVVGSAIGLYYYLRVIVVMYMSPTLAEEEHATLPRLPVAGGVVLAATMVVVAWLGVYPAPLIGAIQAVLSGGAG